MQYVGRVKRKAAAVSTESTDYELLGVITSSQADSAEAGGKPWMVYLQMNNQLMELKIDSGADITVIAETDYLETRDGPLQIPYMIPRGRSFAPLTIIGKFSGQLQKRDKTLHEDIFVVKKLHSAILGCPAMRHCNLQCGLSQSLPQILQCPKILPCNNFHHFSGKLDKLKGLYHIAETQYYQTSSHSITSKSTRRTEEDGKLGCNLES